MSRIQLIGTQNRDQHSEIEGKALVFGVNEAKIPSDIRLSPVLTIEVVVVVREKKRGRDAFAFFYTV